MLVGGSCRGPPEKCGDNMVAVREGGVKECKCIKGYVTSVDGCEPMECPEGQEFKDAKPICKGDKCKPRGGKCVDSVEDVTCGDDEVVDKRGRCKPKKCRCSPRKGFGAIGADCPEH